jgi:hypothetical protein
VARDLASTLDRVRKLLALASSPNVFEAAAAAAQAQALIERHRLEALLAAEAAEAAVEAVDPVTDGREAPLEAARKLRRWKSALAAGLAAANGCVAYTAALGREQALLIAGRAEDRAAVIELWSWLVRRIEWLSATHGGGQPREWHEAFRIGAAEAVSERLREAVAGAQVAIGAASLARIEPTRAARAAAVEGFVRDRLKLKPGRGLRVDAEALAAGRAAGATLPLRPRS